MSLGELTFEAVDDLVAAYARGKLGEPPHGQRFAPSSVAPLIELAFSSAHGQPNVLLGSPWLDPFTQAELRAALRDSQALWIDSLQRSGLMRTVFDPRKEQDEIPRTRFFIAARKSAERVGLALPIAQCMAAALREMESNIHEHSEKPRSGLLAFQTTPESFEFVAVDNGIGVLATLQDAAEFAKLTDHGRALYAALQEGVSRRGRDPDHGNGFRDLFLGLRSLSADLRFRSGDHALTISGSRPDLKEAQLAQKTHFQGFLASVRCRAMTRSIATH
jgi:hypothetical protein